MITGDNPLTACHVARELHFIQKKHTLVLQQNSSHGSSQAHLTLFCCYLRSDVLFHLLYLGVWQWESIDGSVSEPLPPPSISSFVSQYDLCVTGDGLAKLSCEPQILHALLPHIRVFARVSPKQKVGPNIVSAVAINFVLKLI